LALEANEGRLGAVYRLIKSGVDSDRAIVDAGGAANTGAASNLQATIRTILDKKLPNGPSLALQIGRSVGGLLRDNPNLSEDARTYLENLRTRLEVLASDADAIEVARESPRSVRLHASGVSTGGQKDRSGQVVVQSG
jgi:hypothetical protein